MSAPDPIEEMLRASNNSIADAGFSEAVEARLIREKAGMKSLQFVPLLMAVLGGVVGLIVVRVAGASTGQFWHDLSPMPALQDLFDPLIALAVKGSLNPWTAAAMVAFAGATVLHLREERRTD